MVADEQKTRFLQVCEDVIEQGHAEMGIGTYGEKYMHLILKRFFCEDPDCHEVGIGDFFADAMVDDTIYEIQTGSFYPLKKKLTYYLTREDKRVVIVCPVVVSKRLFWVDPVTGAIDGKPRRVTQGRAHMRVLREIYWLAELLDFHRVTLRLVMLSVDEYKKLDGFGADKKKKASKIERIPRELLDIVDITDVDGVARTFLPEGLPEVFTAAEFSALTGAKRLALSADLKALEVLGIIGREGKRGRAVLYRLFQNKT